MRIDHARAGDDCVVEGATGSSNRSYRQTGPCDESKRIVAPCSQAPSPDLRPAMYVDRHGTQVTPGRRRPLQNDGLNGSSVPPSPTVPSGNSASAVRASPVYDRAACS